MAAVAYELRGDSLAECALSSPVNDERKIRMTMYVDEARRYDKTLGIDLVGS
ncbi:MAG: hypothetical protein ABSG36_17495 [Acidimicrobiales bacterium]